MIYLVTQTNNTGQKSTYKTTTCFTLYITCYWASKARARDTGMRSHSNRGAASQSVLGTERTTNCKKILNNVQGRITAGMTFDS